MQLRAILTVLAAVLAVASAAPAPVPAADISAVSPGARPSKSVVDINENENEDLNDENSKIIVYPGGGRLPTVIVRPSPYGPILLKRPHKRSDVDDAENDESKIILYPGGGGGGYPRPPYYPGGGRPPTIIIISPYDRGGPGGGVLLKRPRKRSDDDAEDEDSNVLILPTPGSPSGFPSGRPFPKRDDVDEDSKIPFIKPGVGPRPRYPPWIFTSYPPGYPLGRHQPSQKPGVLEATSGMKEDKLDKKKAHHHPHPYPKRDKAESMSDKKKATAEAENEAVDWEDDDDFADENDDVKYSMIYPPSPYWDPRRPHIMSK